MKQYRFAVLQKSVVFMLCALIACTLSCSHEEDVRSYLASECMAPPIDKPFSFETFWHRGYGSTTLENTLAALRRSIKEEVDFAVVDVRLTSNGIPVLLHDESLKRTTEDLYLVSDLTLAEVKKLDAGSSNSIHFKGEKIPTLEEALLVKLILFIGARKLRRPSVITQTFSSTRGQS